MSRIVLARPVAEKEEADMTIAALLQTRDSNSIISVAPDMAVKDVLALLADKRIGAVPVIRDEQVVGIMSERDMIYGIRREGPAFLERAVSEAMTRSPIDTKPTTTPSSTTGR